MDYLRKLFMISLLINWRLNMIERIDYEPDFNGRKEIGLCTECGCIIFQDMDHYDFNGILICEECKDSFLDNFFVFGDDEI